MRGIPVDEREMRWRAEDDARTLKQVSAITNDPARMRMAQQVIKEEIDNSRRALGHRLPPPAPGRANPATIMKMGQGFKR